MFKLLLICFTLFTTHVFANDVYDSNTGTNIQSIYWLSNNQDGAVVYARHHGFFQLKNFVDTAILTSNLAKSAEFNFKEAEQLLLMLPSAKKWLVVYLAKDQLSFNGKIYSVDANLVKEMVEMNSYRKNKGDTISRQSLTKAKNNFGLSQNQLMKYKFNLENVLSTK